MINLEMINLKGIICINKPKDFTSFDVVAKVRKLAGIKRVGHLGTLDPMATGILLITLGKATKLFDRMQEKKKSYLATFEFGYETDSLDVTGNIISNSDVIPTLEQIQNILPIFVGDIEQLPPKYSAKMIDGKRAYDLAREGIDFELKPKLIKIFDIKLINYEQPILTLQITCGSGTYIRSIGRDIAKKLSTFATMTSLVRTSIDKFDLSKATTLQDLTTDNITNHIVKINDVLDYPLGNFDNVQKSKLLNGQKIVITLRDGIYKLNDYEDTTALIKIENNLAKMIDFF